MMSSGQTVVFLAFLGFLTTEEMISTVLFVRASTAFELRDANSMATGGTNGFQSCRHSKSVPNVNSSSAGNFILGQAGCIADWLHQWE